MSIHRPVICAAVLALLGVSITARQVRREFDYVSIRPAPPLTAADTSTMNPTLLPGGGLRATHTSVYVLMLYAWNLKPYQLAGGPQWAERDLFRVEAKAPINTPGEARAELVRLAQEARAPD